ncbi:bacillithiol biosynthesis cysteine-adding enzyme BshC [Algoriphagus hitonicola]|uniref:Putative cysteine ligase BshC n=1 Tax=Algoriphagus hitonicola TaxID=435880 RepID=A0A1I2UQX5_9BACT|nr:bacillithiol biosynthesis cysteine-adding enzyme BshC [Algoriphagus hitonicola]SFG79595.1 bacillithiol biosynthesis cysteine-adding enzyme BshC [Algoriphagus hitonicola]
MKKHLIDLEKTGQFSSFFLDYIQGKEELRPFYRHLPKLGSFRDAIKDKKFTVEKRKVLCRSLENQYEGISLFEEEKKQLNRLASENTFTVTTGHQLNLFTGPLYFIYKIVSTINLAEKLNKEYPDYHFVPMYWMASEDHDFDEINYFKLDGKKYSWQSDQTGAVGDFKLDATFKEFLKSVSFAPEVFKTAYSSSKTLKEAVRKYVHDLFGEKGLLIIDGHDVVLKAEFKEVMLEDMLNHGPHKAATLKTESLESLGYGGQIFPREINFFYLKEGLRERIEQKKDKYYVLNSDLTFSEEELKQEIENHPERFSPNVVLRPLYQEMILPNLAYLGGPAEVVYWLQLRGVFELFDEAFPILLPRNFALILGEDVQRKIQQLEWTAEDLFGDLDRWRRDFVCKHAQEDLEMTVEREAIESLFDARGESAALLEKSLKDSFEAAKVRAFKILDHMGHKIRKAEERKQKVMLDRSVAVEEYIKPGGSPQERVVNMMQFYLADEELIEKLFANFDPLDFRMAVLEC